MTRLDWCRSLLTAVAGLGFAGCHATPKFLPVADVRELMSAVIDPAADLYWDAVGTVDDSTGSTSYGPTSPEDWATLRNNAVILAESGNLLMMDGRARDRDEWMTLSRAMLEAGKQAIAAATARDTGAVFNAGAVLYESCTQCHARYALNAPPPNSRAK